MALGLRQAGVVGSPGTGALGEFEFFLARPDVLFACLFVSKSEIW